MSNKALLQSLAGRSVEEQTAMLTGWIHAATIDARDTYIPGVEGVADPVRLRRFNELQHQLAGSLISLSRGLAMTDDHLGMIVDIAKNLNASLLLESIDRDATQPAAKKTRRAG